MANNERLPSNNEIMLSNNELPLLIYLSKKIGFNGRKLIPTTQIAEDLNFSQQTASRKLIELEKKGYVSREANVNGVNISLTTKAKRGIEDAYILLKNILESSSKKLTGIVVKGIGEGRFYVQIKRYNDKFAELLGEKAFPGTLNIVVKDINAKEFLLDKKPTRIEGFSTKTRTFGSIDFYKVNINGKISGAIIVPERTAHPPNIVEVIAPVYLRDALNLNDNDFVTLE